MKLSVGALATMRLVLQLVAVAVVLSIIGGIVMTASHRDAVAAAERLEQVNSSRDAASWKSFQVTVAAQRRADDKVVARLAARDRVAADRAARRQSAMDKVAREQAARAKARREQVARDKAVAEQVAREAVLRAKAEKRAAIRDRAERRAADRRAAARAAIVREARAAARQEARRQARRQARKEAAAKNVVAGEMTEPDVVGALTHRVGGRPGQGYRTLTAAQQRRLRSLVRSVANGRRYACPRGSGGAYRDIVAGAQVSVRSGAGSLLAVTTLTGGELTPRGCSFGFTAAVADASRYQVEVTDRGTVSYTRRSMVASGWRIGLTAVGDR